MNFNDSGAITEFVLRYGELDATAIPQKVLDEVYDCRLEKGILYRPLPTSTLEILYRVYQDFEHRKCFLGLNTTTPIFFNAQRAVIAKNSHVRIQNPEDIFQEPVNNQDEYRLGDNFYVKMPFGRQYLGMDSLGKLHVFSLSEISSSDLTCKSYQRLDRDEYGRPFLADIRHEIFC